MVIQADDPFFQDVLDGKIPDPRAARDIRRKQAKFKTVGVMVKETTEEKNIDASSNKEKREDQHREIRRTSQLSTDRVSDEVHATQRKTEQKQKLKAATSATADKPKKLIIIKPRTPNTDMRKGTRSASRSPATPSQSTGKKKKSEGRSTPKSSAPSSATSTPKVGRASVQPPTSIRQALANSITDVLEGTTEEDIRWNFSRVRSKTVTHKLERAARELQQDVPDEVWHALKMKPATTREATKPTGEGDATDDVLYDVPATIKNALEYIRSGCEDQDILQLFPPLPHVEFTPESICQAALQMNEVVPEKLWVLLQMRPAYDDEATNTTRADGYMYVDPSTMIGGQISHIIPISRNAEHHQLDKCEPSTCTGRSAIEQHGATGHRQG